MDAEQTIAAKVDSSELRLESSSAFTSDPEAHRDACRRLAGLAMTYTVGFTLFYTYSQILTKSSHGEAVRIIELSMFVLALVLGLSFFFLGRRGKLPVARFADFAVAFQIVTCFVIMGSAWGWQWASDRELHSLWAALGHPGEVKTGFVDPLVEQGIRPLRFGGVSGVGLWLLVFPIVLPLSLGRTLFGSLLSVSSVPVIFYGSLAATGTPETLRSWAGPMVLDVTIPTAITAALGVVGSRTHYKLSRELARAKRMGSYQLVERIGAGGMGEVWRAKHRLLVRPAAIKLIRPDSLGGQRDSGARTALARFEREAQATSALTSPHSIEIYDFGATEDGTFFYVMELLDGLDLRTLVERHGPLPAERALFLLHQACHSLADAHAHGLVHRDVKPANVFTCRRGLDLDFVKVLDFGLVKRADGDRDRTQLTMEGVASGTPAFMAPEMATGDRPVDGRADLYALGCVAFWLLTGKLVFEGTSGMQVLLRHVRDVPDAPSSRTELPIPAELDRLVLSLLEKDPDRRPPNARAVAAAIATCAAALPPWTPERAARWWETHAPAPNAPFGGPSPRPAFGDAGA